MNAGRTANTDTNRQTEMTDLIAEGFTDTEILHLLSLRSAYPFVEYVDSRRQWERLQFLKWRFQQGDLQRAEEEAAARAQHAALARQSSTEAADDDDTQDQDATMQAAS